MTRKAPAHGDARPFRGVWNSRKTTQIGTSGNESNLSTLIRCCEQTIHQIRAIGRKEGLLDDEFRQNMQRNLASQLQQVSKQCREQQKGYMVELKSRKGVSSSEALDWGRLRSFGPEQVVEVRSTPLWVKTLVDQQK
eukprot:g31417.t1